MRLATAVGVALIVCAAAGAAGRTTTLRVYFPNGHVGRVLDGSCSGESLVTPRANAWRCSIGKQTYDPCFSTVPRARLVNCPRSPWLRAFVTRIRLAQPLPAVTTDSDPERGLPWAVKLFDGVVCTKFPGRHTIAHRHATYSCTDRRTTLLGNPARKAALWTIAAAVGVNPTTFARLAIQEAVW